MIVSPFQQMQMTLEKADTLFYFISNSITKLHFLMTYPMHKQHLFSYKSTLHFRILIFNSTFVFNVILVFIKIITPKAACTCIYVQVLKH